MYYYNTHMGSLYCVMYFYLSNIFNHWVFRCNRVFLHSCIAISSEVKALKTSSRTGPDAPIRCLIRKHRGLCNYMYLSEITHITCGPHFLSRNHVLVVNDGDSTLAATQVLSPRCQNKPCAPTATKPSAFGEGFCPLIASSNYRHTLSIMDPNSEVVVVGIKRGSASLSKVSTVSANRFRLYE